MKYLKIWCGESSVKANSNLPLPFHVRQICNVAKWTSFCPKLAGKFNSLSLTFSLRMCLVYACVCVCVVCVWECVCVYECGYVCVFVLIGVCLCLYVSDFMVVCVCDFDCMVYVCMFLCAVTNATSKHDFHNFRYKCKNKHLLNFKHTLLLLKKEREEEKCRDC